MSPCGAICYANTRLPPVRGHPATPRSNAVTGTSLIETDDTIYLFEFKLDGTAEEALKQIDDKGYAIPYEAGDKKVVKVGVNFENDRRTIERWVVG